MNGKEVFPTDAKYFDVLAPATSLKLTTVAAFSKADVNSAIEVAHNTYESGVWSRADVRDRAKILNKIAENLRNDIPRLADMEVAQTGRAVREMKAQVCTQHILQHYMFSPSWHFLFLFSWHAFQNGLNTLLP